MARSHTLSKERLSVFSGKKQASPREREMAGEQLRELYESPHQNYAIFALDAKGYITTWSDGAVRMKRYTAEEAIGQHFSMLYPDDAKARGEPMENLKKAANEGGFRGEGVRIRKGGIPFIADVQITPIYREGKLIGFSKVVADVTEQGRIRQEREEAIRDLKIEQNLREKFVLTLTHDLRNPLAAARAAVDLLAARSKDESNSRLAKLALRNLSRIEDMITDLLDVNRITAGDKMPLNIKETDLTSLLKEVAGELAEVRGERFQIENSAPQIGFWDEKALRRVIDNLALNAVKYGDPLKPITFDVFAKGERICLSVHNFGDPITQEDQKHIFAPFRRTKSQKSQKTKGWGIGLSLVRGIVESHGGSVAVKSDAVDGTTFLIELPRDARKIAAA